MSDFDKRSRSVIEEAGGLAKSLKVKEVTEYHLFAKLLLNMDTDILNSGIADGERIHNMSVDIFNHMPSGKTKVDTVEMSDALRHVLLYANEMVDFFEMSEVTTGLLLFCMYKKDESIKKILNDNGIVAYDLINLI